jgi:pentatricopeptide repeat protein
LHLFRRQLTTAIAAGAEGMPAQREDKSAPKKEARKPKPPKKSTIAPTVAKSRTKRDFDPVKKIFTLNREIDAASRTGRYLDAVRVATQIKRLGLSPNRITYLYLLRALVRAGAIAEATALFNEMADSADHPPDVDICNVMLIVRPPLEATST